MSGLSWSVVSYLGEIESGHFEAGGEGEGNDRVSGEQRDTPGSSAEPVSLLL